MEINAQAQIFVKELKMKGEGGSMSEFIKGDRKETQIFAIKNIIVGYCGQFLSADLVDLICKDVELEITKRPCSWAFKPEKSHQLDETILENQTN